MLKMSYKLSKQEFQILNRKSLIRLRNKQRGRDTSLTILKMTRMKTFYKQSLQKKFEEGNVVTCAFGWPYLAFSFFISSSCSDFSGTNGQTSASASF